MIDLKGLKIRTVGLEPSQELERGEGYCENLMKPNTPRGQNYFHELKI